MRDSPSEEAAAAGPRTKEPLETHVLRVGGFQRAECALLLQMHLARLPQCREVLVHPLTGEVVFRGVGPELDALLPRAIAALGYTVAPASGAETLPLWRPHATTGRWTWGLAFLLVAALAINFAAYMLGWLPLRSYLAAQALLALPALLLLGGRTYLLAWRGLRRRLVQVHCLRAVAALLLFGSTPLAAFWAWRFSEATAFPLEHGALLAVFVLLLDQAGLFGYARGCTRVEAEARGALEALPPQAQRIWAGAHRQHTQNEVFAAEMNRLLAPGMLGAALLALLAWGLLPQMMLHLGGVLPWVTPPQELDAGAAWATGLRAAAAVLLVLSPGAFALAVLAPCFLGSARAAAAGALARQAALLDALRQATVCTFARTGVLTEDEAVLSDAAPLPPCSRAELLETAAAAAGGADHALARASRGAAGPPAEGKPAALQGQGIRLEQEAGEILLGNAALLTRFRVDAAPAQHLCYRFACEGKATAIVARDGSVLGVLGFQQRLRRESVRMIRALQGLDVRPLLLTGLDKQSADVIAEQLGFAEVFAHASAANKAEQVAALRKETIGQVVFCGRPAEDAPALEAAHVGLAWGALDREDWESPGNVLIRGRLEGITSLFRFARRLHAVQLRQMAALLAFHAVFVPLAFLGFLPPVLAAVLGALPPMLLLLHTARIRDVEN